MAIEFIAWALEQDLPTGPKFVLVALANRANEKGECWPSQQDISKQTGQDPRSIRRHLECLEGKGIIKKVQRRRKNGSFTSDLFTIQRTKCPADKLADGQKVQQPADTVSYPEPSLINLNRFIEPSELGVTVELWDEYKKHRGRKFTSIAEKRAIEKLKRFHASGNDPTAVIIQTLENGWQGLFKLKDENNERNQRTKKYTADDALREVLDEIGADNPLGSPAFCDTGHLRQITGGSEISDAGDDRRPERLLG